MSSAMQERQFSDLIGAVYDCTLNPSLWDETLEAIRQAFRGESVLLSLNDLRHDRLLIDKSVGWTPEWRQARDRHLPEVHARVSEWFAGGGSLDAPFVASRHLPPGYGERSAYIREVLAPLGIADVMHLFLLRTPTNVSELVVMHHGRYGVATDQEIELAGRLLPHLRRAVTISRVLEARAVEGRRLSEALDLLTCGVVLTDARGAILHPNGAAKRMLRAAGPLQDAGGVLHACDPAAAKELRTAIRLAAQDETAIGSAGIAVRLNCPLETPVFAHVLPIAGSDRRREMLPEATAAVFIGAPPNEGVADTLARTFRLTPAETRLLAAILSGHTLTEAAETLGIARTTAKTQPDSIFSKAGVSRQSELLRLATHPVCNGSHRGAASGHGWRSADRRPPARPRTPASSDAPDDRHCKRPWPRSRQRLDRPDR
jgi:DNA-binding CsgD family transcriptional regulator/PAS domain-containing protein